LQHSPDERAPVPLAIHHTPLCLTFAYYDNLTPVLDPTHLEEVVSAGTMTITLNAQRELCVLSKAGGSALTADEIMDVVRVGVERVRAMVAEMEEALAKDKSTRVVEVL
jgi:exosome complex component RRP45